MAEPILPMVLKDVMITDVVQVPRNQTVREASNIMKSKGIGCIVVTDKGKILGIVTERDIIHKVVAPNHDASKTLIEDLMTPNVISLDGSRPVEDAVDLMEQKKIKKLPIVEGDKLVGIVTMTDMIRILRQIEKSMLKKLKEGFLNRQQ